MAAGLLKPHFEVQQAMLIVSMALFVIAPIPVTLLAREISHNLRSAALDLPFVHISQEKYARMEAPVWARMIVQIQTSHG